MKRIVVLGITGSIGQSTLAVARQHPDKLQIVGAACGRDAEGLAAIAQEFNIPHTSCYAEDGMPGLIDLATLPEADMVLIATVGTVALKPAFAAIEAGKDIALASKEILVLAGSYVMAAAQQKGIRLLPVDSEHNAIFQCLEGAEARHVRKILLTASGGPFRNYTRAQMEAVTPEQALKHPNWDMGAKITIDSSTLANKGLEMIEARWLFHTEPQGIQVVVHPQSIVHSMVEFVDGCILAQLSPPSMTFAIQHCLLYPERAAAPEPTVDFTQLVHMEFGPPDEARFPCLRLARESLIMGGTATGIFNSANNVAVQAFLEKRIPYLAIPRLIEQTLQTVDHTPPPDLDGVLAVETEARHKATELIKSL